MSTLRTSITSTVAVLCLAVATPALAQEAGSYKSTFKKVVDNCDKGLEITNANLTISKTERTISVAIDTLPTLQGKAGTGGKLHAEAKGKSGGMDVRYGLNGRVSDGALQAVFVAEYFTGKRPLCTQSFRVVGTTDKAAPAPKKALATGSFRPWYPKHFGH